mmetsp:Transcript_6319/g.14442  ORF Transcript_6319/g.14442 Transcript_6319/m.14442 type:complete len:223 (-) Transcript_6319:1694-2362(-)
MTTLHRLVVAVELDLARQLHWSRLVLLVAGSPRVQRSTQLRVEGMPCTIDRIIIRFAQRGCRCVTLPSTTPYARLSLHLEASDILVWSPLTAANARCHVANLIASSLSHLQARSLLRSESSALGVAGCHSCLCDCNVRKYLAGTLGQVIQGSALVGATIGAGRATAPHTRLAADLETAVRSTGGPIDAAQAGQLLCDGHASSGLRLETAKVVHVGFRQLKNH